VVTHRLRIFTREFPNQQTTRSVVWTNPPINNAG
jgi:hypothetical protein